MVCGLAGEVGNNFSLRKKLPPLVTGGLSGKFPTGGGEEKGGGAKVV